MEREMIVYLFQFGMNGSEKQWFNSSFMVNLSLIRTTSATWISGYLHENKQLINGCTTQANVSTSVSLKKKLSIAYK